MPEPAPAMQPSPAIVVHGGAGERDLDTVTPARAACREAARAGLEVLGRGGSALDAVEVAVRHLEDEPLLNAGCGAVLNEAGVIEVDAAIMSGADLRFGAVGAVPNLRHPVSVARRVLEDERHVLLAGAGAIAFARAHGIEPDDPNALVTPATVRRYVDALARRRSAPWGNTVGAVARDRAGHVAAATSTGGTSFKHPGRIGDTPLPGCGTYADDLLGAVSATGHGENIMRLLLGKRALDLCAGAARPPTEAASAALDELAARTGGKAGLILIDREGRIGVAFTTMHMPYAAGSLDGAIVEGG